MMLASNLALCVFFFFGPLFFLCMPPSSRLTRCLLLFLSPVDPAMQFILYLFLGSS